MKPTCENCGSWHRMKNPDGYGVCGMTGQLTFFSPGPFGPATATGNW